MKKTIETKAADVILQRKQEVNIAGTDYSVAPPTLATVIMLSELVSYIPQFNTKAEGWDKVSEMLRIGKDCRILGDIVALQVLGAKGLKKEQVIEKKLFWWSTKKKVVVDKQKELAKILLTEITPEELYNLYIELLYGMEIGHFFAFTASLAEVNLLKPTTEAGMTVSGQ